MPSGGSSPSRLGIKLVSSRRQRITNTPIKTIWLVVLGRQGARAASQFEVDLVSAM